MVKKGNYKDSLTRGNPPTIGVIMGNQPGIVPRFTRPSRWLRLPDQHDFILVK